MKIRFGTILEMKEKKEEEIREIEKALTLIGRNRTLLGLKQEKQEELKHLNNKITKQMNQELQELLERIREDKRALEILPKTDYNFIRLTLEAGIKWRKKIQNLLLETEIEIEI